MNFRNRVVSNMPLRLARAIAIAPLGLAVALGLAASGWVLQATIVPQAAQAYTARVNLFLSQGQDETYEALIRRADNAARAATQRSFDADILVTEVVVIITADKQGNTLPIMQLQASRQQWSNRPDPRYWSSYFPNAQDFLEATPDSPEP
ncbi:MAG: hypothetical protein AAFW84_18655 [Cyanobacteria bacterium J06635_15]